MCWRCVHCCGCMAVTVTGPGHSCTPHWRARVGHRATSHVLLLGLHWLQDLKAACLPLVAVALSPNQDYVGVLVSGSGAVTHSLLMALCFLRSAPQCPKSRSAVHATEVSPGEHGSAATAPASVVVRSSSFEQASTDMGALWAVWCLNAVHLHGWPTPEVPQQEGMCVLTTAVVEEYTCSPDAISLAILYTASTGTGGLWTSQQISRAAVSHPLPPNSVLGAASNLGM